jgi:hypothetical protein
MPDLPVFDFKQPIQNVEQPFEEFVKEAKTNNSPAINKTRKSAGKYLLVTLLGLNILGLGVFGYISLNDNQVNQPEVAGEQEILKKNTFSGTGYSIVTDKEIPKGYKASEVSKNLPFLQNLPGNESRYLIEDKVNGNVIKSGFEIFRAENNNALNETEYTQAVRSFLGNDYVVDPQTITLPNQIFAYKLSSPRDQNIYYYVARTTDNYYLIKVYNQSNGVAHLSEYTDFINTLPNTLFLN